MIPAIYTIPPHTKGDSWKGISSLNISINSGQPPHPLVSAKMQFKKNSAGRTVFEFTTEDDTILITNAATWEIQIPKTIIDSPAFNYVYDLQTVDSEGDKYTYLKGTWEIVGDTTRP